MDEVLSPFAIKKKCINAPGISNKGLVAPYLTLYNFVHILTHSHIFCITESRWIYSLSVCN